MEKHNRSDVASFIIDRVKKWCVLRAPGGYFEAVYMILEKGHTDLVTSIFNLNTYKPPITQPILVSMGSLVQKECLYIYIHIKFILPLILEHYFEVKEQIIEHI